MLNVCLVGCGRAGMIHARNYVGSVRGARLIALCDPSQEALSAASSELGIEKCYSDYQALLANDSIDAVVIVAPTSLHKEITLAAAQAGKHVFCEKPMAKDEAECSDMISACKAAGVKLQLGFMRRFDESMQHAFERVQAGDIGDVVLVKSLTRGPSKPREWMYDVRTSFGPIGEVNSHDFDTLRWFSGSEVKSIYAQGGNFRSPELAQDYPEWYDSCTMSLRFYNGSLGLIDGAQYVRYGYDARVEILGTEGTIFVGQQPRESYIVSARGKVTRPMNDSWSYLYREAYVREDQAFVDAILNDSEPLVTGYDGKMAVRLVSAGLQSLLENRVVELAEN